MSYTCNPDKYIKDDAYATIAEIENKAAPSKTDLESIYADMIVKVHDYFSMSLSHELLTAHTDLLKRLSIRDRRTDLSYPEFKEYDTIIKDRLKWIEIVHGLNEVEMQKFALYTLFVNSKLSVIHITSLGNILLDIVKPYIVLYSDKKDIRHLERLLLHILVISRMMQHYVYLFSYGFINFIHRDRVHQYIKNGECMYRVSFNMLGYIIESYINDKGITHHPLGREDSYTVLKENKRVENYDIRTIECDRVVLTIFDQDILQDVITGQDTSKVFNVFNRDGINVTVADLVKLIDRHAVIAQVNSDSYLNVPAQEPK
jgi:hypothetical protein